MKFYKEREFKDTEIGRIPKDWKVVRLEEIAYFETGKRMKGGGLEKGEVLSIGGEHIGENGQIILESPKYISKQFYEAMRKGKVQIGDIILCKDGAKTGKVAYIGRKISDCMAVNEHVFVIRPKVSRVENLFIFYFLFSSIGQKLIKEAYHGIIGGITTQDIANVSVPLPPLSEQGKISEILSTVDSAIQKTEEVIGKAERLKKGLMRELLTKGLGHKEFKDTEIGRIPKDWEVVDIKELCEFVRGTEPGSKSYNTEGIGYRFIRVSDLSKQILEPVFTNEDKNKLVFCDKQDILLTLDGVPGIVNKGFNGAISSGIRIVKPKTSNIDKGFLFYILQHRTVQRVIENYITGTTIKHASRAIDFIKIPLPSLSEQESIAEILSTVDRKIELERKRKEKLERIKKGLMNLFLTGKIRVKEN